MPGEPYVQYHAGGLGTLRLVARAHARRTHQPLGALSRCRNGPYDFKPRSRDGLGFDWPLAYDELAPYYDKVEMLIGVYGANDGLENTPNSSPGCLLPPPTPRVSDLLIAQRAKEARHPGESRASRGAHAAARSHEVSRPGCIPGNPDAQQIIAEHMRTRAACFWATPCGRGCSIRATYQSTTVHLPPALATGKLDILVNAMVREVTLGKNGLANGVSYIDKHDWLSAGHAAARTVVLAASACETVRILLNSKSARFADGLANSSGKVGRYLMDTVGSSVDGQIPLLEKPAAPQRGWRERRTHLRALVAVRGAARRQARFRARLPHRVRRRPEHAGSRLHGRGHRVAHRRQLRPQVQRRRAALLRLVRRTSTVAAR